MCVMSDVTRSRRDFLRLAGLGAAGALAAACLGDDDEPAPAAATPAAAAPRAVEVLAAATPEPTPRPVPPAGRSERQLMAGTEWANPLLIAHSGREGARVLVLGGVHGNEPGGWSAAESIVAWEPLAGSLLVVPRANVVATYAGERTLPELGDLNRLYPGSPTAALPMERMANEIVSVAREFEVDLVLDLHESWGFYAERTQNGTAFLGQTITNGSGPLGAAFVQELAAAVNAQIAVQRDLVIARDRSRFQSGPTEGPEDFGYLPPAEPGSPGRSGIGRSSLAIGRYATTATAVLVEMGQQDQPLERRVELHQLIVRSALELRGML
jgi:hypothetical protein